MRVGLLSAGWILDETDSLWFKHQIRLQLIQDVGLKNEDSMGKKHNPSAIREGMARNVER